MNEISVDCWNTSKGETQTMYHFKPIEEFKATAAISRLARSHVISDHPGFEPNLAMGTITLNMHHDIFAQTNTEEKQNKNESVVPELTDYLLANKIAENLVEQKAMELELEAKQATGILNSLDDTDDGTTHKFLNITFTENVTCQSCNKKVICPNYL